MKFHSVPYSLCVCNLLHDVVLLRNYSAPTLHFHNGHYNDAMNGTVAAVYGSLPYLNQIFTSWTGRGTTVLLHCEEISSFSRGTCSVFRGMQTMCDIAFRNSWSCSRLLSWDKYHYKIELPWQRIHGDASPLEAMILLFVVVTLHTWTITSVLGLWRRCVSGKQRHSRAAFYVKLWTLQYSPSRVSSLVSSSKVNGSLLHCVRLLVAVAETLQV